MFWLILAGIIVLSYFSLMAGRWLDYWKLVEYTDINNYARNATKDELDYIFAERLAEKRSLLLYRERVLATGPADNRRMEEYKADMWLHLNCETIYRRLFESRNRTTYFSWSDAILSTFKKN